MKYYLKYIFQNKKKLSSPTQHGPRDEYDVSLYTRHSRHIWKSFNFLVLLVLFKLGKLLEDSSQTSFRNCNKRKRMVHWSLHSHILAAKESAGSGPFPTRGHLSQKSALNRRYIRGAITMRTFLVCLIRPVFVCIDLCGKNYYEQKEERIS